VLLWVGWGDIIEAGGLQTYAALQNASRNRTVYAPMRPHQPTTPRYQIIVGDWGHGGGLDDGIVLEWFETWLKGINTGIQHTNTPMHLAEQGTNRWINAAQYPPVSRYTPWYLSGAGALTSDPSTLSGSETLQWGQPTAPGALLEYTTPPLPFGATLAGP